MDLSNVNNGVFGVSYNFDTADRLKIYVTKDSQALWYDILPKRLTYFPLQLGNGIYKVRVVKEINNTGKYSVVFSKNVALDIPDDRVVFTNSISEIFWTPEMAAIVFAYERTNTENYEWDMVVNLYDYMVKNYKYDYDKISVVTGMVPGYVPSIEVIFPSQKLICYDYSVLFAGMLRSLDIPVKLVKGYSTYVNGYHAWNEVYNPDTERWIVIDITVDSSYYIWKKAYNMEKDPDDYTVKYIY